MRKHKYAALSAAASLFFSVIILSISTRGQSSTPSESGRTSRSSAATHGDVYCSYLESKEQSDLDCSDMERKLRDELSNLAAKLEKELGEMQPRLAAKLDTLSTTFAREGAELGAKAAEAQAKAARAIAREAKPFFEDEESGWLGVEIAEVTPEKAKELKLSAARGVLVMEVESEGPAAKAGLKENDVITEYEGQTVEGTVQFRRLVRETPPGRSITLVLIRDGHSQKLSVDVGNRGAFWEKQARKGFEGIIIDDNPQVYAFSLPDFGALAPLPGVVEWNTPMLGINAEDLRGQLGNYFGAPDGEGILVREVRPGTSAEKAGLKAGDVITKVEGQPVRNVRELRQQLREKSDQKTINLSILRRGAEMNVPVTVERPRPIEKPHITNRAQL